ncbi:hypothetical protein LCL61_28845 [Amycolatopsis coloradensis]|uniref:Uncharacterized protein n=1 Tax=Amycolatopsis coloradensis TaxID=76021 RepID=A0ACD5BJT2_9PSEU
MSVMCAQPGLAQPGLTRAHPEEPGDVDISVEFERLRDAGKMFADELVEELRAASRGVRDVYSTSSTWERPELNGGRGIGFSTTGSWPNWSLVRDDLVGILDTTANQVVEVGEYLIAAANYLEREDTSAKEAMEQAGRELGSAFGEPGGLMAGKGTRHEVARDQVKAAAEACAKVEVGRWRPRPGAGSPVRNVAGLH